MPPSFLWDTLKRNINKLFFVASLNIFVSEGPRTVGQDHQKVKKPHIRPRKEEKQLDTSVPLKPNAYNNKPRRIWFHQLPRQFLPRNHGGFENV